MDAFSVRKAATLQEALQLLETPGAVPVAGGTELLNLMREGLEAPATLIDLGMLAQMKHVVADAGRLSIGSLANLGTLADNALIREQAAAISQALLATASPQIRNMATVGGNLMQRVRCDHFRNGDVKPPCNQRTRGAGCSAIMAGGGREFAALDESTACIAVFPSDFATALIALDAVVTLASSQGERTLRLEDFYDVPDAGLPAHTALRPGELIIAITVPAVEGRRSVYLKLRDRASFEFAMVGAALALQVKNGAVVAPRVVLSGVSRRPLRLRTFENQLSGQLVAQLDLAAAIDDAMTSLRSRPESAFKLKLASRLILRGLTQCIEEAP